MSMIIPESHQDLLTRPLHVALTTLMADGSPQMSIVWRLWDAPYLLVSSHRNSQKTRNVHRNPQVGLLMVDPQNSYRYLEIRGIVEEIHDDPAYVVLDRITHLYLHKPYYGGAEPVESKGAVEHVYFRILPQKVNVIDYRQLV